MAFRLYIVPRSGSGTKLDPYRPKYFHPLDGIIQGGQSWGGMDYGNDGWFLVGADLTGSDDTLVIGQPDAFGLPFDLSPLLTAPQVTNVQNKLEAANIPSLWVTTALTWRQVVHTVIGMFLFLQRFNGVWAEQTGTAPVALFTGGATLATTFGSLPANVQTALITTAQSFGFSTAGLTAGTTLRVILKAMADAFQAMPFTINGNVF